MPRIVGIGILEVQRDFMLGALIGLTEAIQSLPIPDLRLDPNRFERQAPLPGLPSVLLDAYGNGIGVAQTRARGASLQARILWIDATANLERVSSDEKVAALLRKVKEVGFTTIVYDVKPIVGFTTYPSQLTEKITEWRGQRLPIEFDPLASMVNYARRSGLELFVSLNAFSEGHRLTRTGPGYSKADQQTVQLEATPVLSLGAGTTELPVHEPPNPEELPTGAVAVFTDLNALAPFLDRTLAVLSSEGRSVYRRWSTLQKEPLPIGLPPGGSVLVAPTDIELRLYEFAHEGNLMRFTPKYAFRPISENHTQWPLMMNPHDSRVQDRALAFAREVLARYPVQGIVFDDRLRFGGMNADFSPLARSQFERAVGKSLKWPDDVYEVTFTPDLRRGMRPGPHWDRWLSFRARTLRDWVRRARKTVQEARPGTLFGVYQGSWYGEYFKYGSNWASPRFEAGFDFLTEEYRKTGYADELDFVITGCYYRTPTIVEAMERQVRTGLTVEAAGQLSNRAVRDQAWTYAGIMLMDYEANPYGLARALQAAAASTQGIMVFDLSHGIDQFWGVFKQAFAAGARSPHMAPELLRQIRDIRRIKDQRGDKDPPVVIREGSAGTGF